jgi:hypothetical protein
VEARVPRVEQDRKNSKASDSSVLEEPVKLSANAEEILKTFHDAAERTADWLEEQGIPVYRLSATEAERKIFSLLGLTRYDSEVRTQGEAKMHGNIPKGAARNKAEPSPQIKLVVEAWEFLKAAESDSANADSLVSERTLAFGDAVGSPGEKNVKTGTDAQSP